MIDIPTINQKISIHYPQISITYRYIITKRYLYITYRYPLLTYPMNLPLSHKALPMTQLGYPQHRALWNGGIRRSAPLRWHRRPRLHLRSARCALSAAVDMGDPSRCFFVATDIDSIWLYHYGGNDNDIITRYWFGDLDYSVMITMNHHDCSDYTGMIYNI